MPDDQVWLYYILYFFFEIFEILDLVKSFIKIEV